MERGSFRIMYFLFGVLFLFVVPVVIYILRRDLRRHITPAEGVPRRTTTYVR